MMNNAIRGLKTLNDDVKRATQSLDRVVSLWLYGELIYAVLPLLVLAAITLLLGERFSGFLELKEWSFATIIFFGVSIRDMINLKVRVQQTPKSYKLDTGVQLFVVLLIAAVLVLALVILAEKHVLPERHGNLLGLSQFVLFFLGASSLLMSTYARDAGINWAEHGASPKAALNWRLRRINREISIAEDRLTYLVHALSMFPPDSTSGVQNKKADHADRAAAAIAFCALERIRETSKEIEHDLKVFLAGPSTVSDSSAASRRGAV